VSALVWDPAKHPHRPAGSRQGGQWAPKEGRTQAGDKLLARLVGEGGPEMAKLLWDDDDPRFAIAEQLDLNNAPSLSTIERAKRAAYEMSQEWLRAKYPEGVVTLYRGGAGPEFETLRAWTPHRSTAKFFARGDESRVFERTVPIEQVQVALPALPVRRWVGHDEEEFWLPDDSLVSAAVWDPAKHPHRPAGSEQGGEWAPKTVLAPAPEEELWEPDIVGFGGKKFAGTWSKDPDDLVYDSFEPQTTGSYVAEGGQGFRVFPERAAVTDRGGVWWKASYYGPTDELKIWTPDYMGGPHHMHVAQAMGWDDGGGIRDFTNRMDIMGAGSGPGASAELQWFDDDAVLDNKAKARLREELSKPSIQRQLRVAEQLARHPAAMAAAAGPDGFQGRWERAQEDATVYYERLQRQWELVLHRARKAIVAAYRRSQDVIVAADLPAGSAGNVDPSTIVIGKVIVDLTADVEKVRREMQLAVLAALAAEGEPATYWELLARTLEVQLQNTEVALQDTVRPILEDALAEGWSVPQTADALNAQLTDWAPWQATRLARTDLIAIANGTSFANASRLGAVAPTFKTWLTAGDEKVRPTHVEANRQTVPLDQPFDVDGVAMMYPGDPSAPDALTQNCRCTLVYGEGAHPDLRHSQDDLLALSAAVWDPAKHPHRPAGDDRGGEWAPKLVRVTDRMDWPTGWLQPENVRGRGVYFTADETNWDTGWGEDGVLWKALLSPGGDEIAFWFPDSEGLPHHEAVAMELGLESEGLEMPSGIGMQDRSGWRDVQLNHARDIHREEEFHRDRLGLVAAVWDPAKHPHEPGGRPEGGQWASTYQMENILYGTPEWRALGKGARQEMRDDPDWQEALDARDGKYSMALEAFNESNVLIARQHGQIVGVLGYTLLENHETTGNPWMWGGHAGAIKGAGLPLFKGAIKVAAAGGRGMTFEGTAHSVALYDRLGVPRVRSGEQVYRLTPEQVQLLSKDLFALARQERLAAGADPWVEPELEWLTAAFDESKHPRHPVGSERGGQFARKFDVNVAADVTKLIEGMHAAKAERADLLMQGLKKANVALVGGIRVQSVMSDYYDPSVQAIVLEHGRAFDNGFEPIEPDEKWTAMGECFGNATHIAWEGEHPDWSYTEGYAYPEVGDMWMQVIGEPIHHAWMVTPEGKVYDPTWGNKGTAYVGVPLDEHYVYRRAAEREIYGAFSDNAPVVPPGPDDIVDVGRPING
jgi:hypothetical protein